MTRYKACLCVRGDLREKNAYDNRAITLAVRVFRALVAIASQRDHEIHHLDVVNAFVQSHLPPEDPAICKFPPGWKKPRKLLRLRRALFGLRKSTLLCHPSLRRRSLNYGTGPSSR